VITGYELMKSQRIGAQLAIIRFFIPPEGAEREAYTFSRVVIRQLEEEIAPIINQGKVVKAKVVRTKRYLMLAPPRNNIKKLQLAIVLNTTSLIG